MATRSRPSSAWAWRAATATLSKKQNPIAARGRAWCPGGLTSANAPRSTAAIEIPAARSAASYVVPDAIVSPSSQVGSVSDRRLAMYSGEWHRSICSSVAGSASPNSPTESSSTSIRRGVSGWWPVGCRRTRSGWLRTSKTRLVTQGYLVGSARAARRSAIWFMPQSPRRRDASAHCGDWVSRGERGAEASNVAIRR